VAASEAVHGHKEARHRGGGSFGHREPIDAQGMDAEHVAVFPIPGRGLRPLEGSGAEVVEQGAPDDGAVGPGPGWEAEHAGRDVDQQPVPHPARGVGASTSKQVSA